MAAAAVPLVALVPAAPVADDPVQAPANHPLVVATQLVMDWQPVAGGAGVAPQVTAPKHILLYVFGTRFRFSPAPADLAAARNRNIFTLRFSGAAWSRLLSQLHSSGLGLNLAVPYATVPHVHAAIAGLTLLQPVRPQHCGGRLARFARVRLPRRRRRRGSSTRSLQ